VEAAEPEPVSTGCGPLDDLLGGGLERGAVTQVYGPPAAGKTNVCLAAAARVAADGGTAVYLDTEGLSLDRFEQVLEGAGGDPEAVADRILVTDVHDFEEQEEAVRDAAEFASRADLLVLDSATGFYRLRRTESAEGEALRRVARQVTHLLSLARKHDLAALLTNQVYTDPDADTDRTRALGGHTLNHWTATVIRLERFRAGNRRATLEKHRSRPAGETAEFRITDAGLAATE
jgi:DNA repair protein RadB